MTALVAVEDSSPERSECWCCGTVAPPVQLVRLGNHPEVALCLSCARWASKQAAAIEDRTRKGPLVVLRTGLRHGRDQVVRRGWHSRPVVGRPLRWLGRLLP